MFTISGYYGCGNTGDEAVLTGMLRPLREAFGQDLRITVLSANPARTQYEHPGVDSAHRYRLPAVIRTVRRSDLVISGGGSLLQDVTSARSALYYLAVLRLARLLHRRTMIYAQGIGPLIRPRVRAAVAGALNRTDLITVRDEDSRQLLKSIGVRRPIHVTADPAFLLDADYDSADAALDQARLRGRDVLGVSLRPWPREKEWLSALAEGVRRASDVTGLRAASIPMQEGVDERVCGRVAGTNIVPAGARPETIRGLIARCGLVVGMRLHSAILAAAEGVPFVPVVYDPKVASFAAAVGQPVSLDIDHLTAASAADAIVRAWQDRATLAEGLRVKAAQSRELAATTARLAAELLAR